MKTYFGTHDLRAETRVLTSVPSILGRITQQAYLHSDKFSGTRFSGLVRVGNGNDLLYVLRVFAVEKSQGRTHENGLNHLEPGQVICFSSIPDKI